MRGEIVSLDIQGLGDATDMMIRCLVITSPGKKGHMRQAQAVALALNSEITLLPAASVCRENDFENYNVVIASGRQSIAPARRIARGRKGRRPVVAVLQPVVWRPSDFDLVWAPFHDRARRHLFGRAPLVETLTAPSAVAPQEMADAAEELAPLLAGSGPPYVGVLVGGPSRAHRFGRPEVEELATRLGAYAAAHETTMLLTTSNRTPAYAAEIFRKVLPPPHFVFDAAAAAPPMAPSRAYAAILGLANSFIVTEDSVAMMSEAAATGKPIYGWHLPGGKARFERFHRGLEEHGALRWFDGSADRWHYPPLNAARTIADALRPLLDLEDSSEDRI